jgi:hypothetical protein
MERRTSFPNEQVLTVNLSHRTFADLIAGVIAVAIGVIGTVAILSDEDVAAPTSTTTVSKDAVDAVPGTEKTTKVVEQTGKDPATRTTTTETVGDTPEKPAETTTTTEEGERTFLERALGDDGLVLLQIGVAVLAAFLAGALIQRVLLGEYGFKLGTLELGTIARASTQGIKELGDDLKKLRQETATSAALKQADDRSRDADASLKDDLALAYKRMDVIERRLDDLKLSGRSDPGNQQ